MKSYACLPVALALTFACAEPNRPPPGGTGKTLENSDALCSDGLDNDGNGVADCDDLLCQQTATVSVCRAAAENTQDTCHDTQDNDNDGKTDCADPDCEAFGCFENSDATCSNGLDDDDDGYSDCDDFDCSRGCNVTICGGPSERTPAECGDNTDNDGDGFVDCVDFNCRSCVPACQAGLGENTVTLCTDRADNDGDGRTDCRDDECVARDGVTGCDTGEESTAAFCGDGIDNDNDPWIDCADRNCAGVGTCVEDSDAACSDGLDNDGDRYVDCQDFDCSGLGDCGENNDAECSDGLDNDGNSFTDCEDFGCRFGCDVTVCPGAEKHPAECADNVDNDGDNRVDCQDRGCQDCIAACQSSLGENTLVLCGDAMDNDGDGGIDCRDTECIGVMGIMGCDTGVENTPTACSDQMDNDNDPWIDCADRSCRGIGPCVENTDVLCADGSDNDNDGFTDCDDFDCSRSTSVTVCGTPLFEGDDVTCADGQDNDNDTFVDCDDNGCRNNAALEVCPAPIAATIPRLQDPAHPQRVTFPTGQTRVRVRLDGVTVTSALLTDRRGKSTFFVQDAFPPAEVSYHGIEVYAGDATPAVQPGQVIDLFGFYTEFNGLSEIQYGKHEVRSTGAAVTPRALDSQQLATATLAEPFEGVLLELGEVRVVAIGVESRGGSTPEHDDFTVREASAADAAVPLVIGTLWAPKVVAVDDRLSYLRGPLTFTWTKFRLAARSAGDYGPGGGTPGDDDGDGLANVDEARLGTNPAARDTDGDGDEDLAEVIDPSAPSDRDCDGVIDAVESNAADADGDGTADEADYDDGDGPTGDPDGDMVTNAIDANDDGDSVCDPGQTVRGGVCTSTGDNCPSVPNDDQDDADIDGVGDACDPDIDGDEVCNAGRCLLVPAQCTSLGDNCDADANPTQVDTDTDRSGDACDPDDDADGICDPGETAPGACTAPGGNADNCPLIANAGQENNDFDTRGDACDADDDDDGVCDPGIQEGTEGCVYVGGRADNCPLDINPTQVDTDLDGLGDACDGAASAPLPGDVLINEIMADPFETTAIIHDTNGDGVGDASADEFIELVNVSGGAIDLAGCELADAVQVRHRFEGAADPSAYVFDDDTAYVVFGGGAPTGLFGGATVETASSGQLGLGNASAGDSVTLRCGTVVIATMTYGAEGGEEQSLCLSPEADPAGAYVAHTTLNAARFSPGTCADGVPFPLCD